MFPVGQKVVECWPKYNILSDTQPKKCSRQFSTVAKRIMSTGPFPDGNYNFWLTQITNLPDNTVQKQYFKSRRYFRKPYIICANYSCIAEYVRISFYRTVTDSPHCRASPKYNCQNCTVSPTSAFSSFPYERKTLQISDIAECTI